VTQSGQGVRSTSRRAAYWRKNGRRKPSETSLFGSPPPRPSFAGISSEELPGLSLPNDLINQALLPLPESSYLFQEALASPENLDESDLWRWEHGPPYVVDSGSTATPSELCYTERLVEVIHGVQLREQRKADDVRRCRYRQMNHSEALEELVLEVKAMLEEWKTLSLFVRDYTAGAREMTMAQIYLQWQARTIHHLYYLLFI
jgi:hypothetical protein